MLGVRTLREHQQVNTLANPITREIACDFKGHLCLAGIDEVLRMQF